MKGDNSLKTFYMKNILITGGTGLIGSEIRKMLEEKSWNTAILTRNKQQTGKNSFYWNYDEGVVDKAAIEFADVIIHLTGENISSRRWTEKQKKKILDSRVGYTRLLYDAVKNSVKRPEKIVSASAIGYYGAITSDKIFSENDSPGDDFISEVVKAWEEELKKLGELGIAHNILRIGVVMSPKGGALAKMITPVRYYTGSPIGSGKQFMPWIEISDLARMFLFLIESDISGEIFNAVAPQHITNGELMEKLAKAMRRPMILPPVPTWALRLLFGEMSVIMTTGSRVSSQKIRDTGFEYEYKDIVNVLSHYFR